MSKAIGYTRLSQDSDTSIERQQQHIEDYAVEFNLELERIYDDGEYSSGFDDDREEYQELRNRVQNADIEAVVVNDKRRLARDFDETMRLVLDLRENNIELHTCEDGQLDLSEPMQAAVEVVMAASEFESKQKEIERAREAVQERMEMGYDHGRPPIGFEFDDDGHYWVPGEEFDTVVEAIQMVENGATYGEVEETLGIATSTLSEVMENKRRYLEQSGVDV